MESPPGIPFTLQITPALGLPEAAMVAVKICAPLAGTVAEGGVTVTEMSS